MFAPFKLTRFLKKKIEWNSWNFVYSFQIDEIFEKNWMKFVKFCLLFSNWRDLKKKNWMKFVKFCLLSKCRILDILLTFWIMDILSTILRWNFFFFLLLTIRHQRDSSKNSWKAQPHKWISRKFSCRNYENDDDAKWGAHCIIIILESGNCFGKKKL